MKILLVTSIGLLLALNCIAQEPALPSNSPVAEPQATAAGSPPSIIPAAPVAPVLPPAPAAPDLSQLDASFKQTPLGKAAEEYRLHVEWRQLQNRAAKDPQVIAAKTAVDAARTDLEKRKRFRAYYELYYRQMTEMASTPEVKAYVAQQKAAHIATTAQDRVRPVPSTTPAPSASP
jgi:hypothetical protein